MICGSNEALGMTMKVVKAFGRDDLWEEMSIRGVIRSWKHNLYQS